jgi:LacI family transcriptional regulator
MKRKATIKDIALIAKISPTAVSMALNNRSGVSAKTRERVLKIAEKLEYHPSYVAKTLIGKQSNTIALVVHTVADPFYAELALGVEEKASELGYSVLIYNTGVNARVNGKKEKDCIDNLRARGVDGVILSTVTVDDPITLCWTTSPAGIKA